MYNFIFLRLSDNVFLYMTHFLEKHRIFLKKLKKKKDFASFKRKTQ